MKKIKLLLSLIVCTLVISCSPLLYLPASTDAVEQQQLMAGRKLYVDHCGSCHNLHLPKEFIAEVWKKNLDEMQVKANLNDKQKQLIYSYLTAQP